MKYAHDERCVADACIYGECIHDARTGERIDPVEITREITAEGEVIHHRLRQQEIFTSDPS